METVVIALGSNVGNRHRHLKDAHRFLSGLSTTAVQRSAIYLTEPVGPAQRYFLNAAIQIGTDMEPKELLSALKNFEYHHGRRTDHPKWSARTIDLDIICFGDLVIQDDTLIIPHPEYRHRLFVLKPLKDIYSHWQDPQTGIAIDRMIRQAPALQLKKTTLNWENEK